MTRPDVRKVLVCLAAVAAPSTAPAAAPEFQSVSFTTGDGVELAGRYAPGRHGRKSPAVIVLDDVRDAARPADCRAVAEKLAAAGCAVLTFDFRGHGGSTAVGPTFWADPTNRRMVRGYHSTRPADAIAYDDFRTGYLPALANDLAAARAFLERRNDAGECNVGQLYVVGFGHGATLGALWVASEWDRFRCFGTFPERLAPTPEGRDVVGCVWVDPERKFDRQTAPLTAAIRQAAQKGTTLFGLVHPVDDTKAAALATEWAKLLNSHPDRPALVTRVLQAGEPAGTAGRPEVAAEVAALIAAMRKVQSPPPWDDRDFDDRTYLWVRRGARPVVAKAEGEEAFRPLPTALLFSGR